MGLTLIRTMIIFAVACPVRAPAGTLMDQFGGGYKGVPWGSSLSTLQSTRPGGKVGFGTYASYQAIVTYQLADSLLAFGISRPDIKVSYGICLDNFKELRLSFPVATQHRLLKNLNSMFGKYQIKRMTDSGLYYEWTGDSVLLLSMYATSQPPPGTVAVSVMNKKYEWSAPPVCGIPTSQYYGDPE